MVSKRSEAIDIGLMVQLLFHEFFFTPMAHSFHSALTSGCGIGDNQTLNAKQGFIGTWRNIIRRNSIVDVISYFLAKFSLVIFSPPIQFQDYISSSFFYNSA
jgi:hypothetical protein